ncbi:helix-turn-helix transcriptional regulator [Vallitalea guaymasensis]|uniref:helix-turn-helix transcriptional regulator n=1 Tax=Vallitalea guaymasensis TaxID=1185412 RepID=UPI00187D6CC0|nr:WYL domain-containing protein [Vallitalea guaymasensis]
MERMIIVDYYTPIKNSWLTREISPLHLFYCEGCWYLDAFCNVRKAKRTFRLDRIKSCELLKKDIPEEHMKTYEVNRLSENVPEITLEIDKGLYEQVKDDYIFKEADITKEINSYC